jgi:hypothetical protein
MVLTKIWTVPSTISWDCLRRRWAKETCKGKWKHRLKETERNIAKSLKEMQKVSCAAHSFQCRGHSRRSRRRCEPGRVKAKEGIQGIEVQENFQGCTTARTALAVKSPKNVHDLDV